MKQELELMLGDVKSSNYLTGLENVGSVYYTPPPGMPIRPIIEPMSFNCIRIDHQKPLGMPDGFHMHDTYKVDRYDNLYGGHTTFKVGRDRLRIDLP